MVSDTIRLELWKMLLQDPEDLGDELIETLLREENTKWIALRIGFLFRSFPHYLEQIQSYRAKKREMSEFSTEELLKMKSEQMKHWTHILRTVPDEDLEDSFFESPPMDSEEHIVYEILKERGIE